MIFRLHVLFQHTRTCRRKASESDAVRHIMYIVLETLFLYKNLFLEEHAMGDMSMNILSLRKGEELLSWMLHKMQNYWKYNLFLG